MNNKQIWGLFDILKNKAHVSSSEIEEYEQEQDQDHECDYEGVSIEEDQKEENEQRIKRITRIRQCINCNSECIEEGDEYMICTKCGADNGELLDEYPEWRYYGLEDNKRSQDPSRCGVPFLNQITDNTLGIVIMGKGNETYRKLNSWNGLSYRDRNMINTLNTIMNKANLHNIPKCIIDKTMVLYKMISDKSMKRGASKESLLAACLFNALKEQDLTRSADEIASLFNLNYKKLSKGCNEFSELMSQKNKEFVQNIKPLEPKDLIIRFSERLNLDERLVINAIKTSIIVDKLGICQENNPKSIAVGCLYFIVQIDAEMNDGLLKLTKKDIAEVSNTSEVTISQTFTHINKKREYIIAILFKKI